ncbi:MULTISPECIES: hypothetical protein [Prosthecochloris]|uniref:ABC transporter permease n=1 Tax=Prosthecochloris marina TaxID=2017681 RepID=A0A317T8T9_9CHLB|nr:MULTISPECIES: hypothetical protein [Prosthecochloris]PWW83169.1 hypothetical protein CR164_01005 [Prosthecochloris marina]UZJ38785.1 hypothetical protein OO005_06185 [Prosthecochloris sp. SCSIO W1103]
MELEITWGRVIRVWWAYLWRNLVAILVATILGAIVGGVMGAILYMSGVTSVETLQLVITPISIAIGLVISLFPIKMILGKDFGEFRLVLVENGSTTETKSGELGGVVQ